MTQFDPRIFKIIILSAWFLKSVAGVLSHISLWQLKEYRFDRMRVHLSTSQGRKLVFNFISILKWLILVSFPVIYLSEKYKVLFPIVVTTLFVYESAQAVTKFLFREQQRPIFTLKAKIICAFSIITQGLILILIYPRNNLLGVPKLLFLSLLVLILDRTLTLFVGLAVLLLTPLTKFSKKWIVRKAKIKLKGIKDIRVIGITGSYGKTSTKYFLDNILSSKYKVLKTYGSENTDIGVANTILNKLQDNHKIFIVEMGAYKIGEISTICEIVNPQIGILTAVGQQHLSIFLTRENILKAKLELIESLPRNGLAVINGDFVNLREHTENINVRKLYFGHIRDDLDIKAKDIVVAKRKIRFTVESGGEEALFEVSVLGRHNIINILAATLVAQELGFSLEDIVKAVRKIKTPPKTMEMIKGVHGATFINDTFNANPEGVKAALKYLDETDWHKKIVVFQPLIELGTAYQRVHIELASLMGSVCDRVYFTNDNYKKYLLSGYKNSKKRAEFIWLKNRKLIASETYNDLEKHDVVLFEGKEAERVLKYLRKRMYV